MDYWFYPYFYSSFIPVSYRYACTLGKPYLLMRAFSFRLLTILGLSLFVLGCDTEKEDLQLEAAGDYVALQPGKYITYRLDSTVFVQQGRAQEIHSYQEKHQVDAEINDNLGRKSYRVFRYIRNLAGTSAWSPAGTYLVTPLQHSLEVIEDNMRIVKLFTPVKEGATWKGNRYLAQEPYASKFNFNNDDNMAEWDFEITSVGETATFGTQQVENIVTLLQQDETINDPTTTPDTYATRTLSVDKYARGLGLVYQEFIMWEYQPNPGGTSYRVGFGVKRSMIDHN